MLAHANDDAQKRQRQHRRQNSTPTAVEGSRVSKPSAPSMHRYAMHRRGLSLDQQAFDHQRYQSAQALSTANPALYQHVLREAQQQRLSRPVHPYAHEQSMPMSSAADCQSFGQEDFQDLTNHSSNENPYDKSTFEHMHQGQMDKSATPYINGLDRQFLDSTGWGFYTSENMLTTEHGNGIPGGMRRLSVQSDFNPQMQRPHTPTRQISSNYFPMTPATTPFKKSAELASYSQGIQPSPTKKQSVSTLTPPETSYMQRARSLQGVPGSTFAQQRVDVPSPPNTASFDVFDGQKSDFENPEFLQVPKVHAPPSPGSSSFQSAPELADMPSPEENNGKAPKVPIVPATTQRASPRKPPHQPSSGSPTKTKLSPRVASIDSLNLDSRIQASITETGITLDEIASYIYGPDPEDGKWVCLHPGCERRFGRKENIKSHVQTHLGDRQYKCDHCDKCFVRGHDLKRHAKIHTGDKPYECLCGNMFARHDALTRHRQRGMCIGGYKGVVRKTTKRGRPKKHRPEMEERQDKAARTRQRVAQKSSAASVSGSDVSSKSPPTEVLGNMSLHRGSPHEEAPMYQPESYGLPPDVFTFTPPASPGDSTGNKPSSPTRSFRSLTPAMEDERLPQSPSKRPLENIPEEVPELHPCLDSDATVASGATVLSSPHTIPTLGGSTSGSELEIFINQDASSSFGKHGLPGINDPDMAAFPDYDHTSSFEGEFELFHGKNMSDGATLNDDFFLQFQSDEHLPSDAFFKSF
ncbi:hypothetical protein VTN00DRAFT_1762 [Thermoascus crustaceus]|uniref:uncharacterized protein n=1 Tax=Thermoascus crustaceus TaxID=5088 RepID=UPI003743BAF5